MKDSNNGGFRATAVIFYTLFTFAASACAGTYSGGSGTAEDPYRIATKADLMTLATTTTDYGKCFILIADIDLGGQVFTKAVIASDPNFSGDGYFRGTAFTGSFNGCGFSISNWTIDAGNKEFLGLFGKIGNGGQVLNLGLDKFTIIKSIKYSKWVGGLCGYNSGTISQCSLKGEVAGDDTVGGLTGVNIGTINQCSMSGTISGDYDIGGLCGYNDDGTINQCYTTGSVTGFVGFTVGDGVGGFCSGNSGKISYCYTTSTVKGHDYVGGFCGSNRYGSIYNSYSTGKVTGFNKVGGFCGNHDTGAIDQCYSTGDVSGSSDEGGFCGYKYFGTVSRSFWDYQTSGQMTSAGGTSKTTAQMKMRSTYTAAVWDFSTTDGDPADWMMLREGQDYPRLAWQPIIPGDIAGLYGVDLEDLLHLSERWLMNPIQGNIADLNRDGRIDFLDFGIMAENWKRYE